MHAAPLAAPTPPLVVPPSVPETRFDETAASSDWRQTLRNADSTGVGSPGIAPGSAPAQPAAPRAAVLPPWLMTLGIPAGMSVEPEIAPVAGLTAHASVSVDNLEAIAELIRLCTRCALHTTARNPVPGEGNPHAELLCVGEAPGATEDEQGRPFVGEAGQLLTKILAAIQLSRDSVYICNVLKHRPPANRDPLPEEVTACRPFLQRQVELIRPRVILALGRFAAQTLLGTSTSLGQLRGHVHQYRGIPVIATYHPAALLRNDAWKRPTWDDVKLARSILDASRAADRRVGDQ
ncbi:MAG: uracil-DNA glycosylase [Gemmatimonadaceae bacterium]|nr:uracil-DNA glycosylase [Gemmatimonadaceae bacterium]